MYIHKYTVGEQTIYVVSERSSKPSKNMILTSQNWLGYSSGSSVGNAIKFLKELSFSREEKEEHKKEDKAHKTKKRALSEIIKEAAQILDPVAAVLSAHTKHPSVPQLLDAAGKIRGYGKGISEEELQKCLDYNSLKLRSSSPSAFSNLYTNIKKIKDMTPKGLNKE